MGLSTHFEHANIGIVERLEFPIPYGVSVTYEIWPSKHLIDVFYELQTKNNALIKLNVRNVFSNSIKSTKIMNKIKKRKNHLKRGFKRGDGNSCNSKYQNETWKITNLKARLFSPNHNFRCAIFD